MSSDLGTYIRGSGDLMKKQEMLIIEFLTIVLEYFSGQYTSNYDFTYINGEIMIIENNNCELKESIETQELVTFLQEHLSLYGCEVTDCGRIVF